VKICIADMRGKDEEDEQGEEGEKVDIFIKIYFCMMNFEVLVFELLAFGLDKGGEFVLTWQL